MPIAYHCGTCGATLPEGAPDGQCPECLLQLGLAAALPEHSDAPGGKNLPLLRSFGDYELIEEIARGGMGVVFKARQISLYRVVAVKMILAGHFAGPDSVRRFRTEAEATARLRHPNIVAIHEIGEHDGQQFFSMDYIEGHNLAEAVREKPMAAKRAAALLQRVAEAIHYAHGQGLLHRDLKPSNILLDANDQPHVTDFGLVKQFNVEQASRASRLPPADFKPAKETAEATAESPGEAGATPALVSLTLSGQILGSPNFMPPEQAMGKRGELTPASDVYSLGALLYHVLTGRPPFLADSVPATLRLVMETEPTPPRLLTPTVPRDLETICLKCLEKDPARRYESAKALADDLGRWLRDEPIHARRAGQTEKLWRWFRCQPVAVSLVAPFVALSITYFLIFAISSQPAEWRVAGARVGLVASLLVLLLGLLNGIAGLASNKRRERPGICWAALSGAVLNCLLIAFFVTAFARGSQRSKERKATRQFMDAVIEDLQKARDRFYRTAGSTNHRGETTERVLNATSRDLNGDSARLERTVLQWRQQCEAMGQAFVQAARDLRAADVLNYSTITNRQILRDRRETVQRFLIANDAWQASAATNLDNYATQVEDWAEGNSQRRGSKERAELESVLAGVAKAPEMPPERRERWLAEFRGTINMERMMFLELHEAVQRFGQSLVGILSLLETNRWRVDASARQPTFEEAKARTAYQGLIAQRKAAAEALMATQGAYRTYMDAVLLTARRVQEALGTKSVTSRIPVRDLRAKPELIDLSRHYNAALDESWLRNRRSNDLASLPAAIQEFAGTAFDVRGLIQLSTAGYRLTNRYPDHVDGIRMNQRCTKLHFLHAGAGGERRRVKVGHYLVHYADRRSVEVPLIYAEDLRDWWHMPKGSEQIGRALMAWRGTNAASAALGASLRLFKLTWTNPKPEVAVETIDFVSGASECAPFLIAITAEP